MKRLIASLFLVSSLSWAGSPNVTPPLNPIAQVLYDYSIHTVLTSAYSVVLSNVPQTVSTMEVFDSSGATLQIAQTMDNVHYLVLAYIYPGGNGMVRLPVTGGSKIAIKAVTGTVNTGYLVLNLYN